MQSVFKCDYCSFMGTEEEVAKHEPQCTENYDRRSCLTCAHSGWGGSFITYVCRAGIDIPEGNTFEFCSKYERKMPSDSLADAIFDILSRR